MEAAARRTGTRRQSNRQKEKSAKESNADDDDIAETCGIGVPVEGSSSDTCRKPATRYHTNKPTRNLTSAAVAFVDPSDVSLCSSATPSSSSSLSSPSPSSAPRQRPNKRRRLNNEQQEKPLTRGGAVAAIETGSFFAPFEPTATNTDYESTVSRTVASSTTPTTNTTTTNTNDVANHCSICLRNNVCRARCSLLMYVAHGLSIVGHLTGHPRLLSAAIGLMRARRFDPDSRQVAGLERVRELLVWSRHEPLLAEARVSMRHLRHDAGSVETLIGLLVLWGAGIHARLVVRAATQPTEPSTPVWLELLAGDRWITVYQDEYDQPRLMTNRFGRPAPALILAFHRNLSLVDVTARYIPDTRRLAARRRAIGLTCCRWLDETLKVWSPRCRAPAERRLLAADSQTHQTCCAACLGYLLPPATVADIAARSSPSSSSSSLASAKDALDLVHRTALTPLSSPPAIIETTATPMVVYPTGCMPVLPMRYSRYSVYPLHTRYEWLCRGMSVRDHELPMAVWRGRQAPNDPYAYRRYEKSLIDRRLIEGVKIPMTTSTTTTTTTTTDNITKRKSNKTNWQFNLYGVWQTTREDPGHLNDHYTTVASTFSSTLSTTTPPPTTIPPITTTGSIVAAATTTTNTTTTTVTTTNTADIIDDIVVTSDQEERASSTRIEDAVADRTTTTTTTTSAAPPMTKPTRTTTTIKQTYRLDDESGPIIPLYHPAMLPLGAVYVRDIPRPAQAVRLAVLHKIRASRALVALYPEPVYVGLVVDETKEVLLRALYQESHERATARWKSACRNVVRQCDI